MTRVRVRVGVGVGVGVFLMGEVNNELKKFISIIFFLMKIILQG